MPIFADRVTPRTVQGLDLPTQTELPNPFLENRKPRWFAAYTSARHEKTVALQLTGREIEHFLPLYESLRQWKDRRIRLELALFPGYVFVRIPIEETLRVLRIQGVVRLVGFGGNPAALADSEIESIRNGLAQHLHLEPHRYLKAGRRVRIRRGPLEGLEGILLRKKNSLRVVVSVDLLMRAVAVEVEAEDIGPTSGYG